MNKKIILTLFITLFWLLNTNIASAAVTEVVEDTTEAVTETVVPMTEEESCFALLNEKVSTDARFQNITEVMPNWDLTEVLFNESAWSSLDLSTYETFQDYVVENPSHKWKNKKWREDNGLTKYDFFSRRTNIATVIANDRFVVSQVVWFWRNSNFDFPVTAEFKSYGDKYKLEWDNFKEFVLYTHHSITWDFLSCGLFRLIPLEERTYWDVPEEAYFTNTLQWNNEQARLSNNKCSSGFEWEFLSEEDKDYYAMKTNVCALDYGQNDFVKQEILAIAYDNGSDYFNEYDVFQQQVTAMKDTDTTSNGLAEVRAKFLQYLKNNTNLSLVNGDLDNDEMSYNKTKSLLSYVVSKLIPSANAAREFNFDQEYIDSTKGMVMFEALPYELYEKLEKIPSKTFVEYIKLALTPNFEDYIKYRKDNNIVLSSYERVFASCGLSYEERNNVVVDLLEWIEDPENFDPSNVKYSNKKFGDCIIPYPDSENRKTVIEDSFESNKLLAQKLNGTYEAPEVELEITKMIEEENSKKLEYQQKIDKLTNNYNEGLISWDELEQKVNEEKQNLENSLKQIEDKYSKIFMATSETDEYEMIKNTDKKTNPLVYVIVAVLLILWIALLFMAFNKNKNK